MSYHIMVSEQWHCATDGWCRRTLKSYQNSQRSRDGVRHDVTSPDCYLTAKRLPLRTEHIRSLRFRLELLKCG